MAKDGVHIFKGLEKRNMCDPQSLKHLISVPLQKKFTHPVSQAKAGLKKICSSEISRGLFVPARGNTGLVKCFLFF